MSLQHILKNSSVSGKEPLASQLANGELSINYHADGPFLCCKDTAGNVRRVAGVWVSATAPSTPFPGELWLDTGISPSQLKVYKDATDAWVFAGEVNTATTTTEGVVRLATNAEAQGGTSTTSAVTPAALQSKISDSTSSTSSTTIASSTAVKAVADTVNAALPKSGGTITGILEIGNTGQLRFEGSSNDAYETTLAVEDPTATRTITLPDRSGTVITTGDTGTVTSTMIADGTIVNADINASAAIAGTKISPDFGSQNLATTGDITIGDKIIHAGDTNTAIRFPANDAFSVETAGNERLRVDSSGRLGLGTSSPGARLTIGGTPSSGVPGLDISDYNANVADTSDIVLSSNGVIRSSASINNVVNTSGYFAWKIGGSDDKAGIDGSSDVMRIDSSGVGIGTSSPDASLHVNSAGNTIAKISSSFNNSTVTGLTIDTTGDSSTPRINFQKTGTTRGVIKYTHNATANDEQLSFNIAGGTDKLVITGAGTTTLTSATSTAPFIAKIGTSEVARIDGTGRLLVGTSSSLSLNSVTAGVQLHSTTTINGASLSIARFNNDNAGAKLNIGKSRNGTIAAGTIVQENDDLGSLSFIGDDGTDLNTQAARIGAFVDGTPGANDMPGRLTFSTTPSGSASTIERLRIDSAGTTTLTSATSTAPFIAKIGTSEVARIDGSGRLLVGTSSSFGGGLLQLVANNTNPTLELGRNDNTVTTPGVNIGLINFYGNATSAIEQCAQIACQSDGSHADGDKPSRLVFSTTSDSASSPSERMRITSDGDVRTGNSAGVMISSSSSNGHRFFANGVAYHAAAGNIPLLVGRNTDDGTLVAFYQAGTFEGNISVAGSTVSYNPFLGSHWGRLADGSKPDILPGTILDTVDQLIEWKQAKFTVDGEEKIAAYNGPAEVGDTIEIDYEGNSYSAIVQNEEEEPEELNKHVCVKVNDTASSKAVFGVFLGWDDDIPENMVSTWNDLYCAAVGNYFVRIANGETLEIGSLIEADGNGCGIVQNDDIIRSKTVAKITSTIPQKVYDDGSFLVTCVLCCG